MSVKLQMRAKVDTRHLDLRNLAQTLALMVLVKPTIIRLSAILLQGCGLQAK